MIFRRRSFLAALIVLFLWGGAVEAVGGTPTTRFLARSGREVDATILLSSSDRRPPAHGALLAGVRAAAADSAEWLATPIRVIDVSTRRGEGREQAEALREALAEGADGLILAPAADFPWNAFARVFRAMDLPVALPDDADGPSEVAGRVIRMGNESFVRAVLHHWSALPEESRVIIVGDPGHALTKWMAGMHPVQVVRAEAFVPPEVAEAVWWVEPPPSEAHLLRERSGPGARVLVMACHPAWIRALREGWVDQVWQPSPFDWGYAAMAHLRAAAGDPRLREIAPEPAPVVFSKTSEDIAAMEELWARWLR